MSSAASGFGSQVSIWLAPPYWTTKMQDRAWPRVSRGRGDVAHNSRGSDRPSIPSPPSWSSRRRVGLSQNACQGVPEERNILSLVNGAVLHFSFTLFVPSRKLKF